MTLLTEHGFAPSEEISKELVRIAPKPETIERQRLIEIAEWLEGGALPYKGVSRFNMQHWIDPYADCGTQCCIAGAAVLFNLDEADRIAYSSNESLTHGEVAQKLLGLNSFQAGLLFAPMGLSESFDSIQPARAAKVIREYLETGRIYW